MTVASLPLSKPFTKCIVVYFNPELCKEGTSGQYSSSQAKTPQYKPLQLYRFANTHLSPTYLSSLPYDRQKRKERNRRRKEEKEHKVHWSWLTNQSILKEISPWISLEGMMLKLKLPVLWPPHMKSWRIGKDSDAGRDSGQEEKGMTEHEMAGSYHWLNGCESEWTPEVGDGQGGLACCDSWGLKESDTTEQLNWTELNWTMLWNGSELVTEQNKKSLLTSCDTEKQWVMG